MTIEDAPKRRGPRRLPDEMLSRPRSVVGDPIGRPRTYQPEFCEQATKLCALGALNREVADFFGVTVKSIERWCHAYPEFAEAMRMGKEPADDRVERSLYHRANGYSYEAVKIFMPAGAREPVIVPYIEHVPPDPASMIFWLKNRRKWQWSDRVNHEHTGPDGGPIQISEVRRVIISVDKTEKRDLFDGLTIEAEVIESKP
jgi:hypothetical protein